MKRKLTGTVAILLIASMAVWASDATELRTKFTDSLANGNVEEAISNYDDMVSQAGKDYQKAQRSYEKALEAGNMQKAREARRDMLAHYPELKRMYAEDDGNTQVFYLKDAVATFSSFTAPARTVRF